MTIFVITAVHLSDAGTGHQHVASVMWLLTTTGKSGVATTAAIVDFIENKGNDVRVGGSQGWAQVGVVRPAQGSPYLRTHADGTYTDNLLSLPRF